MAGDVLPVAIFFYDFNFENFIFEFEFSFLINRLWYEIVSFHSENKIPLIFQTGGEAVESVRWCGSKHSLHSQSKNFSFSFEQFLHQECIIYQDWLRCKGTFLMYISNMALGQHTISTSRSAMLVQKSSWL